MIITFYSYKGGVGRSQMTANLAAYLCYYEQRKILLMDWDMEAPGIDMFFSTTARSKGTLGLIDLFETYVQQVKLSSFKKPIPEDKLPIINEKYISNLIMSGQGGAVDWIPPILFKDDFAKRVNAFNWGEFYERFKGKYYIEFLKKYLKQLDYDYIFIDSRTGLSDYSGICNIQLPDMNVIVTSSNYQNMTGVLKVAETIYNSPYITSGIYRKPIVMPILSRFDTKDNTRAAEWTGRFRTTFGKYIIHFLQYVNPTLPAALPVQSVAQLLAEATPLLNENLITTYITHTLLDYKTELSYGENLVFSNTLQEIFEPTTIERRYFNIARLLEKIADKKSKTESNNQYSPDYMLSYLTHFEPNLRLISEENRTILQYFSIFPSIMLSSEQWLLYFGAERILFRDYINRLAQLTDMNFLIKNNGNIYGCAASIQKWLREQLKPNFENCEKIVVKMVQLLSTEEENGDVLAKKEHLPFAESVFKHIQIENMEMAILANNIATIYSLLGEYDKSLSYNKLALNIRKKIFEKPHSHLAMSYNNIALIYLSKLKFANEQEHYHEMVDNLTEAIKIWTETALSDPMDKEYLIDAQKILNSVRID
jgi:MinD-like ATPase involved in chromosome partitioning or flagellar assembly